MVFGRDLGADHLLHDLLPLSEPDSAENERIKAWHRRVPRCATWGWLATDDTEGLPGCRLTEPTLGDRLPRPGVAVR